MKKLAMIILALTLALSFSLVAHGEEQRDVSFENTLANDLKALGLFSGVSENNFDLERAPSRTEVLVMLIRVLGEEKDALDCEAKHPFTDVPAWADKYVAYAYENGLTKGVSATKFGNDTASAATYLTFMLRALGYSDAKGDFAWDAPYNFAKGLGLLPSCVDCENFLRADIVTVSYAALSVELKGSTELLCERLIDKGAFTAEVLGKNYTATKITDKENENKSPFSAEDIYSDCSPAVFYIEIQNKEGRALSSGSGFFIDESGIAVTNYHVMEQAQKAQVTLSGSGAKYDVTGIYYYSPEHDVAIIQVDGTGFETLKVNPFPVKGASSVYAIGSPRGLQNTISQGIVSNPRRVIDDDEVYIQTTAPISGGSSGGVLLNVYGEVIGITSAGYSDGQNLNFARPISYIAHAKTDKLIALSDVNWNFARYTLDSESYTLAEGEKLTFEFDVLYSTTDATFPKLKVVSDNTDVCVAAIAYGDTLVNLVGVKAGTATVTISDDKTDNSASFTVTVTEGTPKEKPYVELFANVDKVGLNKGAKDTLLISAVPVGFEGEIKLSVKSSNSTVLKISSTDEKEDYITVDVSAVKNGRAELTVLCDATDDTLVLPVTVGEQFYAAFDMIKEYALENGEFNDAEDDASDYYFVEGRPYTNGDTVNLLYYPQSDKLYLRVTSVISPILFDVVLSRESADSGKAISVHMSYPTGSLDLKASITTPQTFGDGKNDTLNIDEFSGNDATKKVYEKTLPKLVVMLFYEFDEWFRYILPEVDASDLGFVALDYEYYGANLIK